MDPLQPDELWTRPIPEVAFNLAATVTLEDVRISTIRSAILNARVLLDVSRSQEETTRSLVQATHDLVRQTKHLAWATIAVAAVTGTAAFIVAITQ
jgi:hypothetical protein